MLSAVLGVKQKFTGVCCHFLYRAHGLTDSSFCKELSQLTHMASLFLRLVESGWWNFLIQKLREKEGYVLK